VKELDREEKARHELYVRATESCHEPPVVGPLSDTSDSSVLLVMVNVNDINDNAPKFIKHIFTGGFTTETDYGTEFMRVKVCFVI
jgi:cadherin 23